MKKLLLFLCCLGIFFYANAQTKNYIDNQIIVSLKGKIKPDDIVTRYESIGSVRTGIKILDKLVPDMNLWLLGFEAAQIKDEVLLRHLQNDKDIEVAQFNHRVTLRAVPNDVEYTKQWQWQNIKAEQAWNITTGGLTPEGDTIVIGIIDSGMDNNHVDLKDNIWRNSKEIPNNGIDDDNNGYVDDVRGWNIEGKNDNTQYTASQHGISVAGMVGAKGNNALGVTGINWNVKMMMITASTGWLLDNPESNVIAAYGYMLKMRKLYNETKGAKGAFVVASNASWGIDKANPADSPIWCNLYDTLGVYGILNCGATTNTRIDVDVLGDLPTTCPSNYLIGVQASNQNDLNTSSGYGLKNIDVAAPGTNIYTTRANNTYTNTTGTSFASPTVAGLVGLMYAAPSNLSAWAKTNPGAAALLVRKAILDGVDVISGLATQNATSGRINAFKAINEIIKLANACPPVTQITVNQLNNTEVALNYSKSTENTQVNFNYRKEGSPNWITIKNTTSPIQLKNLDKCATYQYYFTSYCTTDSTKLSVNTFKTLGCCESPDFTLSTVANNAIQIDFSANQEAQKYQVRYKSSSASDWQILDSKNNAILISNLDECTKYEFQMRTICDTTQSSNFVFSASRYLTTLGCSKCLENNYCIPKLVNDYEWIKNVTFATLNNDSNNPKNGYALYSSKITTVDRGQTYTLSISPGFKFSAEKYYYLAWVDYNQDGDFDDDNEVIYNPKAIFGDTIISTPIFIPWSAKVGGTRMRIGMKTFFDGDTIKPYSPCLVTQNPDNQYGEFEDYCINIGEGFVNCKMPTQIKANTSKGKLTLNWAADSTALGFEIKYKSIDSTNWIVKNSLSNQISITLPDCKKYDFQLRTICQNDWSEWTNGYRFSTFCSSNATDISKTIQALRAYPNPFSENVVVEFTTAADHAVTVQVSNLLGQTIFNKAYRSPTEGLQQINIENANIWQSGYYFITISDQNSKVVTKVVKW